MLDLGLEAYEICRVMRCLENRYKLMIDRTSIDITKLNLQELCLKIHVLKNNQN